MSAPSTPGPTPAILREFRKAAGLTIAKAAQLVYVTESAWSMWEAGKRAMPYAMFELFCMKTEQMAT